MYHRKKSYLFHSVTLSARIFCFKVRLVNIHYATRCARGVSSLAYKTKDRLKQMTYKVIHTSQSNTQIQCQGRISILRFLVVKFHDQLCKSSCLADYGPFPVAEPQAGQHWHHVPFSSPWPRRPRRPITTLQGSDVICTMPMHHSHSFCRPILRADNLLLLDLEIKGKKQNLENQGQHSDLLLLPIYSSFYSSVECLTNVLLTSRKITSAFSTSIAMVCERCQ